MLSIRYTSSFRIAELEMMSEMISVMGVSQIGLVGTGCLGIKDQGFNSLDLLDHSLEIIVNEEAKIGSIWLD